MRKLFVVLALLVALVGFGTVTPDASAAGGGGGSLGCSYECDCTGQPLKCCPTLSGGTACKPTDEFQCPQVITC